MNLLILNVKIAKIEIKAEFSNDRLVNGEVKNKNKARNIIKDEFDKDITLELNARRIFNVLQPECYQVSITGKGLDFTVIAK